MCHVIKKQVYLARLGRHVEFSTAECLSMYYIITRGDLVQVLVTLLYFGAELCFYVSCIEEFITVYLFRAVLFMMFKTSILELEYSHTIWLWHLFFVQMITKGKKQSQLHEHKTLEMFPTVKTKLKCGIFTLCHNIQWLTLHFLFLVNMENT